MNSIKLEDIRDLACAREASSSAVLYALLARLSSLLPPNLCIDLDAGHGPASLNYFTILVGEPIDNALAVDIAKELLPSNKWPACGTHIEDYVPRSELALMKTFLSKREPCRNLLVNFPSSTRFDKNTQGRSFLAGALSEAYFAETLTRDQLRVPDHSYSLGMVIQTRPSDARSLFADFHNSLTNRLMFVSSLNKNEYHKERVFESLDVSGIQRAIETAPDYEYGSFKGKAITAEPAVLEWFLHFQTAVASGRINVAPYDGHMAMVRIKFAALITLLQGRNVISVENMVNAEIAWIKQRDIRGTLLEYLDI